MAGRRRPFATAEVADVFTACPPRVRSRLLRLRDLIFETAAATDGVGEIEETLKWGEPSYLTSRPRSGTTIRIAPTKDANDYALYVHCQTSLVATFRTHYPNLRYEGKRAIHFRADEQIDEAAVRHCVALALTYHAQKRTGPRKQRRPAAKRAAG